MYERASPFHEYVAGGYVDMTDCRCAARREDHARPEALRRGPVCKVKIEGAGRGRRRLSIVGIRDPYTIGNIDRHRLGEGQAPRALRPIGAYDVYYLYGRNAVMEALDPPELAPHELGIVVEVVHQDAQGRGDLRAGRAPVLRTAARRRARRHRGADVRRGPRRQARL
jgi:hypothetical protein